MVWSQQTLLNTLQTILQNKPGFVCVRLSCSWHVWHKKLFNKFGSIKLGIVLCVIGSNQIFFFWQIDRKEIFGSVLFHIVNVGTTLLKIRNNLISLRTNAAPSGYCYDYITFKRVRLCLIVGQWNKCLAPYFFISWTLVQEVLKNTRTNIAFPDRKRSFAFVLRHEKTKLWWLLNNRTNSDYILLQTTTWARLY